jgi:hypothetical protein
MSKTLTRPGDMHPLTSLNVHVQDDGDIVLWVGSPSFPTVDGEREVEFTTIGSGGGRSPHTRHALHELVQAIKKDNEESPIYYPFGGGKETVLISVTREEKT